MGNVGIQYVVFAFEDLAPAVMGDVLDVVLLDPHWYGGIHRAKLAGQICDTMGLDAGMHSGAEFGISQAAMLHLAASLPNLILAPDSHYHHLTDDIIEGGKMKYKNGGMSVPTGPGLGVSLDRDKLARYHELSRQQEMGSRIRGIRASSPRNRNGDLHLGSSAVFVSGRLL